MLTENAGGKHMNDETQLTDAGRLEKEEPESLQTLKKEMPWELQPYLPVQMFAIHDFQAV